MVWCLACSLWRQYTARVCKRALVSSCENRKQRVGMSTSWFSRGLCSFPVEDAVSRQQEKRAFLSFLNFPSPSLSSHMDTAHYLRLFLNSQKCARTVKTQPFLFCFPLWPGAIDKEKSINTLVFSASLHLQHSFLSPGALLNSALRSGRFYNWPFSTTCASAPLSDQHGNLWFPCRFTIFPDIILNKRATRERVCLAVSHLSCWQTAFATLSEKGYHRWNRSAFWCSLRDKGISSISSVCIVSWN